MFKEDQRKEMKSIEDQLNTIYTEYEKIEKDVRDIKDKLSQENTLDDSGFGELSKQTIEKTELIMKTDSKMSAVIEQANMLMVNDVKQDETIKSLDKSIQNLDWKLSNLESADLFLQESHRLLTEKTAALETQSKKVEDLQSSLNLLQKEEIEGNLKVKLNELLTIVGELASEQKLDEVSCEMKENNRMLTEEMKNIRKFL